MENSKKKIKRIFDAKKQKRQNLARLPIEEKVKILIQLQKIAAPILAARGVKRKPWEI